ncbi:hypothetical protein ISCGN_021108 [Ixodes scapularis]
MAPPSKQRWCTVLAALGTATILATLSPLGQRTPALSNVALKHGVPNSSRDPRFWNPEETLRKGHEGLPFPVEDTGLLPTAYSTAESCGKEPRSLDTDREDVANRANEARYLFFVSSAPGHFRHRAILRSCLGNRNFSAYYRWTSVFFVGLSADNATAERVRQEASRHGDVVVLPYQDTYRNLTYKFVYGIKWTIENCPFVVYVVKLDDDFAVNVLKLIHYLEEALPKTGGFHCHVFRNGFVNRDVKSKWYLSEKEYPHKKFPPYCAGGCVMFGAGALRGLYAASFSVPFHGIDDVYVTGQASVIAGTPLNRLNGLYSFHGGYWSGLASGRILFSHIHDDELRARAWRSVSESLANDIRAQQVRQDEKELIDEELMVQRLPAVKKT